MPETKCALIVANWKYEDADLPQLVAPANDAETLAGILRDPKICGFEVTTLLNRSSHEACEHIERFFLNRQRDDVLLYPPATASGMTTASCTLPRPIPG